VLNLLRLLLVLGLAGSALTFAGSGAAWWFDEDRRLRRLLHRSLSGEPDGAIVARGRNAAAGFRLASGQVVVMRDGGADALLYPLQALIGAELMVDGQIVARAIRDEPRRALDQVAGAATRVSLRLVFDDPRHPDFVLDLWLPEDEARRDVRPPAAAIEEARSWLARAEAILRRAPQVAVRSPAATPEHDEEEDDLDDAPPPSEDDVRREPLG
jgi:hypothetical protein